MHGKYVMKDRVNGGERLAFYSGGTRNLELETMR